MHNILPTSNSAEQGPRYLVRFMALPLQANFIKERIYIMDISLKVSALLKKVPQFVTLHYLTIICTYIQYGNMCPVTRVSSGSYGTVYAQ
jgi:hypothetical protein